MPLTWSACLAHAALPAIQRSFHCNRYAVCTPAARLHKHRPGASDVSACSRHSLQRRGCLPDRPQQLSRHSSAHPDSLTSRSSFPLGPAGAQLPLLQDVSLHLPANQLGLIYGRSGAGKTTLLQLIAGLAEPTAGAISVTAPAAGTAAGGGAAPSLGAKGTKFAQLKAAEAAKRQGGAGTHPPSVNGATTTKAAESGEQVCSRGMHHRVIMSWCFDWCSQGAAGYCSRLATFDLCCVWAQNSGQ